MLALFRVTVQNLSTRGWLANIVVSIVFVSAGPLIGDYMNNPKAKIIGLAIGLTLLIWIITFQMISALPPSNGARLDGKANSKPDSVITMPSHALRTSEDTQSAARIEPHPPTIHDLFLTDFPHFSANFKAEVLPSDGETDKHPKAEVEFRIWHDLTSRTKIIGLYVPYTLNTFDIIRTLPAIKEELLNHKIQSITAPKDPQDATRMSISARDNEFSGVTFKLPNDMGTIDPFKFPFNGVVYVYYRSDLTISQLGELETLFNRAGFTPIFRGEHYAQGRWRDMKATGRYIDLPVDTKARTVEFGE